MYAFTAHQRAMKITPQLKITPQSLVHMQIASLLCGVVLGFCEFVIGIDYKVVVHVMPQKWSMGDNFYELEFREQKKTFKNPIW